MRNMAGAALTVLVRLANMGTTPWSVITARFSTSLAILAMAAHTLASTSLFFDFSKLTMSSKPPTKERTISPASWNRENKKLSWIVIVHKKMDDSEGYCMLYHVKSFTELLRIVKFLWGTHQHALGCDTGCEIQQVCTHSVTQETCTCQTQLVHST